MSATRPWVDAFADDMEAKLELNRHKGDRAGWSKESPEWLLDRLEEEVQELRDALARQQANRMDGFDHGPPARSERIKVRSECADIANFAMMIADVAGGLQPSATEPK